MSKNKLLTYTVRANVEITSRYIYGIFKQGREFNSYNIDTHLTGQVKLPPLVPSEPAVTQIGDRIYLTGGGDYLKSNIEFIEDNNG